MVAPWERVVEPLASNAPETVNAPALVVVTPDAPRVIPEVLAVPILTVPLVAPAPALIITLPPLPPVADSLPPVKLTVPPVPPVPDSTPAVRLRVPPLPAAVLLVNGCSDNELPPVRVVISAAWLPASASAPEVFKVALVLIN